MCHQAALLVIPLTNLCHLMDNIFAALIRRLNDTLQHHGAGLKAVIDFLFTA